MLNALSFIFRKKRSLWEKHQNQDTCLTFSLSLLCQGLFLFLLGMGINIHSDYILRQLRKPGEIIYRIPQGNVSSALQIPLGACPRSYDVSNEWRGTVKAGMTQYILICPWLLFHIPFHPTTHLHFWSESRGLRKVQEPSGRCKTTTLKVEGGGSGWGVWGLA